MVRETTHATGMTLCTHWSQVAAQHLFATPCLSQSNTSESGNMLLRQSYFERAEGETLLSVLRNRLNLTGTKYGCREGQCGACTVLIERRATRCCQVLASATAGKKISTIEGLATGGKLHPVQEAFLQEEAFQCGYCTDTQARHRAAATQYRRVLQRFIM